VGQQFRDKLVAKARQGVDVWVLLDGWGSAGLPQGYLQEMREAGVHAQYFMDFEEEPSQFQINFRNHRKLIVVDGDVAFTGGLNIGTEYLGHNPKLSPWRDTAMRVRGPVVQSMQVPFAEDWYWVTNEIPSGLDWSLDQEEFVGEMEMICLASGPSDPIETCSMFFLAAINNATERVWIAAPYFVPDGKMVTALQMAALRGVDVRVLIPDEVDSWLVHYSSFSYFPELTETGVRISRYNQGFMHQKVVLVDQEITAIGTANFDNRSFRLNFEITGIVHDETFNRKVEEMLEADFARSIPADAGDYEDKSYIFRLKSRLARLLAPIQ
jgi:cardiolipin synthase